MRGDTIKTDSFCSCSVSKRQSNLHENVSTKANTPPINITLSDTPAICTSDVAVSSTIPTISLTLESFVSSTPLMITSHELVPPPTSVSNSHTSVTYVQSLGPPPLVAVCKYEYSALFSQRSTQSHGASNLPNFPGSRLPVVSRTAK